MPNQLSLPVLHGIDCADQPCGRGQLIQIFQYLIFIGHSQIKSLYVERTKSFYRIFQSLLIYIETKIDKIKSQGLETGIMHHRGNAVFHRASQ